MSAIYLVTPGGETLYRRRGRAWQADGGALCGPVRLVVDSADEDCHVENLPKLGWLDQARIARRKAEAKWGASAWCATVLVDRFGASPRAVMFALADAASVETALHEATAERGWLIGASFSSAQYWQHLRRSCKAPLAILFMDGAARMLGLDRGAPVLTRRLELADVATFAKEVRRTWVYLVRQGAAPAGAPWIVAHGHPPNGWREALGETLSDARIDWAGGDWREILFARAAAECAPAALLRERNGRRLAAAGWGAAALSWLAALAIALPEARDSADAFRQSAEAALQTQRSRSEAESIKSRVREAGIRPDLVRAVRDLSREQLMSNAALADDITRLAQTISSVEAMRLTTLDWRASGEEGCEKPDKKEPSGASAPAASLEAVRAPQLPGSASSSPGESQGADRATGTADVRTLQFMARFQDAPGPRQTTVRLERAVQMLQAWPASRLVSEPMAESRRRSLKSGETEKDFLFCLELGSATKQLPKVADKPSS